MDLNEIEKLMTEAGVHLCEICGLPFTPKTKRQCTCGAPQCKAEHHRRCVAEYNRKRRSQYPDVVRHYKAAKMREYRAKQKEAEARERQLKDLADRWERQAEFDRKIAEYGHRYGEVSAQKVLATVPKIDVNLEGRRDHDNVHHEDDGSGSGQGSCGQEDVCVQEQ